MKILPDYIDQSDSALVALALTGERDALQQLTLRHYPFVYNIAWKMVFNAQDAEDLTQEVFLKAITHLSQFKGRSEFRTWLYRIAANHFLQMKKQKAETLMGTFSDYFKVLDNMPDYEPDAQEMLEWTDSFAEVKIGCTAGMLICLDREQRIIYVLGEIFGVNHRTGAEILQISPDNFRQRLTRARADLHGWMHKKCGLVNPDNPCRCPKKTRGFIEAGFVDPQNLLFNADYQRHIRDVAEREAEEGLDLVDKITREVFGDHPFQERPDASKIVEELLNHTDVKRLFRI